jgi:hypothetical protein
MAMKATAEAEGITRKAEAMKLFDSVGKEHEEFKLRLNKEKDVELAQIHVQGEVAGRQADVLGEALKNAKIDIVGGDMQFFDRITGAVSAGKSFDRLLANSTALTDIKETFFDGDADYFHSQVRNYIDRFGLTSEDVKNLSVAAALTQMSTLAEDSKTKGLIGNLLGHAKKLGLDGSPLSSLSRNGGSVAKN